MGMLIIGLVLFLGIHTVSIVAPQWREGQIARLGEGPWKGIYSVISAIGFGLLIYGYGAARQNPVVLYTPPTALRHVALLLMLPVFPLLVAAYVPGRIKAIAKHPMLLATKFWATGPPARQRHAGRRAAVRRVPGLGRGRPHLGQAAAAARAIPGCAAAAVQRRDRHRRRAGRSTRCSCCGRTAGCSASPRCLRYSSRTALPARDTASAPRGHPVFRTLRRRAVPVLRHRLRHAAEPPRCARGARRVGPRGAVQGAAEVGRAVPQAAQHAGRSRRRGRDPRRRAGARGRPQRRPGDRPHRLPRLRSARARPCRRLRDRRRHRRAARQLLPAAGPLQGARRLLPDRPAGRPPRRTRRPRARSRSASTSTVGWSTRARPPAGSGRRRACSPRSPTS